MEEQPVDVSSTEQPASTVGTEVPVEKKSRTGLIIGIVAGVVLLFLLCCCCGVTALLLANAERISQMIGG